jgi:hypothetical protein
MVARGVVSIVSNPLHVEKRLRAVQKPCKWQETREKWAQVLSLKNVDKIFQEKKLDRGLGFGVRGQELERLTK